MALSETLLLRFELTILNPLKAGAAGGSSSWRLRRLRLLTTGHHVCRSTGQDDCRAPANVVQANLLAATTQNIDAVNHVYNVAVGDRTTLNELYAQLHRSLLSRYPHLQGTQPVHRDFRAGDVRHSLADVSKAVTRLGYAPTQYIGEGLELAMPWYVLQQKK